MVTSVDGVSPICSLPLSPPRSRSIMLWNSRMSVSCRAAPYHLSNTRMSQSAYGVADVRVATPAVGVPPTAVVSGAVAVKTHADADVVPQEKAQEVLVEQDAVGLHTELNGRSHRNGLPELGSGVGDKVGTGKQRLAAVEDDADISKAMGEGVPGNLVCRLRNRAASHFPRSRTPGLVSHPVYVAVIARKVASAVQFEYELLEGNRPRAPVVERLGAQNLIRPFGSK